MREIKFRVWDKAEKKIRKDYVGKSKDSKGDWIIFTETMDKKNEVFNPYPRERFELMQFTGLKDMTGVKIYEGDILAVPDVYKDVMLEDGSGPEYEENHLAPVVFDEKYGAFGVDFQDSMVLYKEGFLPFWDVLDEENDLLIIGNIYVNPELIG
jgi:uncharacterized phage protein (TIGR01671 family)